MTCPGTAMLVSLTRHNFTQIFRVKKTKVRKWLSYKFYYWMSIRFDPTAKVYKLFYTTHVYCHIFHFMVKLTSIVWHLQLSQWKLDMMSPDTLILCTFVFHWKYIEGNSNFISSDYLGSNQLGLNLIIKFIASMQKFLLCLCFSCLGNEPIFLRGVFISAIGLITFTVNALLQCTDIRQNLYLFPVDRYQTLWYIYYARLLRNIAV